MHVLFDRHQVIWANGTPSESLYTGPEAIKTLHQNQLEEVFAIFPELNSTCQDTNNPAFARPPLSGRQGKTMALRIKKNQRSAYDMLTV